MSADSTFEKTKPVGGVPTHYYIHHEVVIKHDDRCITDNEIKELAKIIKQSESITKRLEKVSAAFAILDLEQ